MWMSVPLLLKRRLYNMINGTKLTFSSFLSLSGVKWAANSNKQSNSALTTLELVIHTCTRAHTNEMYV